MVCFCDLPKGARETHKERYGYYAISFKKEWANKYKICPVIYCRQKGKVSDYIRMIYNNPLVNKQLKDGLLNYCKPTRGIEFIKEQQKWSDYKVKFLDEREWRYTPKKNDVNTSLPFTLDDILNVYVKDETEISELFGLIDKAKIKVSSKKQSNIIISIMKNLLTYLFAILAFVACTDSGTESGGSGGGQETPTSPANEIWYTSTDGKVVELHSNYLIGDGFGANVVSNVYENGKGVITFDGEITAIADCAFYFHSYKYESTLQSIAIPNTVTQIGEDAFSGCSSLSNITIPDGVTQIGDHAFSGCSSLTSITIPNGVTQIRQETFAQCKNLTSINIPEGVTQIGAFAFFDCISLTSITIPEGVTQIGYGAFCDCSSLTSITIPEGVTQIAYDTFSDCSSLSNITIPEGVTQIGERAFYGCLSLTSITIPDGVTQIGQETFAQCKNLTSITIPEGVTQIGVGAFEGCSSLTSITLPDGVTQIDTWIFAYCSNLSKITIPASIGRIDYRAFFCCSQLKTVDCKATNPPFLDVNVFDMCDSLAIINVPTASVDAYKAADGWKEYKSLIRGKDF